MEPRSNELLQALSGAIEEVSSSVSPSVVSVASGHRVGTGVVLDSEGHIVTAGHVVHGLEEVEISHETRKATAKVLGNNRRSDLALMEVEQRDLTPIELGSSSALKVGQFVLAVANPHGGRPSVTSGIITGVDRQVGGWWRFSVGNAIVTDARLNPGYSGGPLIDANGRMVGMNVAYLSNRGIAVPIDTVKAEAGRIARGEGLKRAYLGIISNPISLPEEVAGRKDVSQNGGLMVFSVEPESSAKRAGLALGDVIVRFGDRPVVSFQDLEAQLGEDAIGKETKVVVLRGEQPKELVITPVAAEGD